MTPQAHNAAISITGDVAGYIRVDLEWWESCEFDLTLSEEDRDYLNEIVVQVEYKPRMAYLENTERARKILGLE
jgi:hypothetical protein